MLPHLPAKVFRGYTTQTTATGFQKATSTPAGGFLFGLVDDTQRERRKPNGQAVQWYVSRLVRTAAHARRRAARVPTSNFSVMRGRKVECAAGVCLVDWSHKQKRPGVFAEPVSSNARITYRLSGCPASPIIWPKPEYLAIAIINGYENAGASH